MFRLLLKSMKKYLHQRTRHYCLTEGMRILELPRFPLFLKTIMMFISAQLMAQSMVHSKGIAIFKPIDNNGEANTSIDELKLYPLP